MSLFKKDPGKSAVFVYETPNCGFDDSVAFMVVCKYTDCKNIGMLVLIWFILRFNTKFIQEKVNNLQL